MTVRKSLLSQGILNRFFTKGRRIQLFFVHNESTSSRLSSPRRIFS